MQMRHRRGGAATRFQRLNDAINDLPIEDRSRTLILVLSARSLGMSAAFLAGLNRPTRAELEPQIADRGAARVQAEQYIQSLES
jgi:hypothetical protein